MSDSMGKRELWRQRMRRYERSGLTVAKFCDQEGVSAPSFYQWRQRLAGRTRRQQQSPARERQLDKLPAFQQVTLARGGVVVVELARGVRMELPAENLQLVRAVVCELLQIESGRGAGEA